MPKSLISIRDFSKEEILHILSVAREMEATGSQKLLEGKVVACLFFEPGPASASRLPPTAWAPGL